MKRIIVLLLVSLMFVGRVSASDNILTPNAKSAILLEASTGEIIYEFNSHEKLAPASMTKMMSLLIILESIEKGIIDWEDMITVSSNASSMGGSQILLETGEQMSVDDLVKGISIASGNDAVVALAESIAGTEENFVKLMNDKLKELGLKDSNFKNSHGLDAENHYSSAYDMAYIARELVKHEKILEYSSIYETYLRVGTDRQTWLVNTNKLVRFKSGVDGLKTGYTDNSGYCLTATMKKDGMRVIATVMGEPDSTVRNNEVSGLLDYAFAQYNLKRLLSTDSIVDTITFPKAKDEKIMLVPTEDITLLYKKTDEIPTPTYKVEIDKMSTNVKHGEVIGKLIVSDNEKIIRTVNLTVLRDVKRANIFELFIRYLGDVIVGDIKF